MKIENIYFSILILPFYENIIPHFSQDLRNFVLKKEKEKTSSEISIFSKAFVFSNLKLEYETGR